MVHRSFLVFIALAAHSLAYGQLTPLPAYNPTRIESPAEMMLRAAQIKEAQARAAAAAAEARLAEQRARDAERRAEERAAGQAPSADKSTQPQYLQDWWKAAAPRIGRFPDFEQVVLKSNAPISEDMVRLMTGSPLAADIAYYFATNRVEAMAVTQMSLLDAARAVDRVERTLKAKTSALQQ